MIIKSILDTDLYKLSMQAAVMAKYPHATATYAFINRGRTEFPEGFDNLLSRNIADCERLFLTHSELTFLKEKCRYLNPIYFDFLKGYRLNPAEIRVTQEGNDLKVIVEGPWYRTILWETPLMALISELYFRTTGQEPWPVEERRKINKAKATALEGIQYAEFGTRRRFSYDIQDQVIEDMKPALTSNVHLAMKYGLIPVGTVAHEWFMGHAAMYGYVMANETALDAWVDVYQGDLGIALPDTFTTNVFLRSFNTKHAKLWDGIRQDSGNPFAFIPKVVEHYRKMKIDPMSKVALFSDGINSPRLVKDIHLACQGKIMDRYGIGTWLSNDVGVKPLNIVVKMTKFNGIPTVKLSDVMTKNTGDPEAVDFCKKSLGLSTVMGLSG